MEFSSGGNVTVDNVDRLLVVQEHDSRIRDLQKELRDIPARKKQLEATLGERRQKLAQGEEGAKGKQAQIRTIETEIKGKREQIAKLRQQQFELKSNEQFRMMEAEIKGVEAEIARLEDRELGVMEEAEQENSVIEQNGADLKTQETAVRGEMSAMDERFRAIENEIKEIEAKRDDVAKDVNPQWLERYNTIFSRRDRALVPVENGVCGGCHMKLPPQVVHNSRKRVEIISCDYCGRMVY